MNRFIVLTGVLTASTAWAQPPAAPPQTESLAATAPNAAGTGAQTAPLPPVVFAPPPPPSPPRSDIVTRPNWIKRPSVKDVKRVYPPQAFAQGIEGRVILQCVIGSRGRLKACEVISEMPSAMGFDAAALALVPRFTLAMTYPDGRPIKEGAIIRIPLVFKP